jgi:hypothetical protein
MNIDKTSTLFLARRLQEQRRNPEKLSWVCVPVSMVSVPRKLNPTEERCQDQSCFGYEITGTKATTLKKLSWFPVLVKMVFMYIEN